MRFEQRLREGLHQGVITLAFRRWKRTQVLAGRRYRTGSGLIEVVAVDVVKLADLDPAQARDAGYATVDELTADLRGDETLPLYRIRFRRTGEPDARDEMAGAATLTAGELATLTARLARMDKASKRGPWSATVLAQIAGQPGTVSTVLAEEIGWPRQDFKLHVRRLKELGLTYSLDVGYRLSPRGEAYLSHVNGGRAGRPPDAG
jgi:hypothetical protein